MTLKIILEY